MGGNLSILFAKSRELLDSILRFSPFHKRDKRPDSYLELDDKIRHLVVKSWGPKQRDQERHFNFETNLVGNVNSLEQFSTALLSHVRKIAPALNVPWLTPRVTVSTLTSAAGKFIEEDGWVKIEVDQNFVLKPNAARAILCHEVCHYILNASGIRKPQTADNERLTDIAIFVFGLGNIFFSGYRSNPGEHYREGHRLGYLTDDEYQYVRCTVNRSRATAELQQDETSELRRQLRAKLLGDDKKVDRYMDAARKRFPLHAEADLLRTIIDDFNSGR